MVGAVGPRVAAVVAVLLVLGGAGGVAGAPALPERETTATGTHAGSGTGDLPPAGSGAGNPPATAPTDAISLRERAPPTDASLRQVRAPPTDATVTRIRLQADGTAVWTVEIRTLLENDTDLAAYEGFQVRFRNDTERYLGSFRERMTRLVDRAGNVTGREMTARNFTASTSIDRAPRRWGVVTYRFRWTGFAEYREDGLAVGDVFESGYYLAASDSLVIEAPEGYVVGEAVPEPTATGEVTVRWSGPVDFGDGRPSLRVRLPATPTPAPTPTEAGDDSGPNGTGTDGPGDDDGSGTAPVVPAVLVGAALVLGGAGAYVVLGRRDGDPDAVVAPTDGRGEGDDGDDVGGEEAAGDDGSAPAAGGSGDPGGGSGDPGGGSGDPGGGSGDPGGGSGAATGGGEAGDGSGAAEDADAGDGSGAPGLDEELLTDEERVVGLLERNGGRMRQADIAEELDWSAPKTSRVLSSMDDDGEIEKLRLGNQNVIDLPGDD